MPHDPFQVPDLNDVHRRILDAVGFKVPASANLDDARDALEDHYLAMKRGPERDRFETAFTLMIYGDVVDGKPEGRTQSKIRALEQSGKTAHSREQEMKKNSTEHGAGSDGNYMTKQNLWLAHRVSQMLYEGIPDGVLLPDWAESKINSATQHLKEVAGWAMHESHGDDLHPPPEANPIHLAGEGELRSKLVRLAHSNPDLRPHLLPLLTKTAAGVNWEKVSSKPVPVKYRSTDAVFTGTLYRPEVDLPKNLGKIAAVVVLSKPKGELNMADWWGGSGYFADAAKKAFGLKGRQSLAYDTKDLGSPIGVPTDASRDGNLTLVYT